MRLPLLILHCILCTGLVCAQVPQQPQPSPLQQAATKVLREMPVKLYEGRATEADVQACLRLIELAPNDNAKRPFFLLIAQYRRLIQQRPEQTLAMLAPHLLGKEKANTWQRANNAAVKVARDQWIKDEAVAKKAKKDPPKLPSNYLVDLPPLAEWTINDQTALFAIEAAHCLAALDRPQIAIEIIDIIGQKYEDETRVLAAECGADLFIQMKMFERAIEFYGFALNVLETLKKKEYDPGKGDRIFFSELESLGQGSIPKRLLWNIQHKEVSLYATPKQMENFKSARNRLLLLLADIEMERMNLSVAEKKFRVLLEDKEIKSNREMSAYCMLALSISLNGQFKIKEAMECWENFFPGRVFSKTSSTAKADVATKMSLYLEQWIADYNAAATKYNQQTNALDAAEKIYDVFMDPSDQLKPNNGLIPLDVHIYP